MAKTDFQDDAEISSSLRSATTQASAVRDNFDAIFRTGQMEMQAPHGELKKIKGRTTKMHNTNTERKRKREAE